MRRRLLKFLATFAFRQAWWLLPLAALLTGAAAWSIDGMNFDLSLVAFLPAEHQRDAALGEIVTDYRKLEPVLAVVRAKEQNGEKPAELIAAGTKLAKLLDDPRFFATPVFQVDEVLRGYYESLSDVRLIMLLTSRDWDELQRLMSEKFSSRRMAWELADRVGLVSPPPNHARHREDPLGALAPIRNRLASSRGPTRLDPVDGYLLNPERTALAILLYPTRSPDNGRDARRTLEFLEDNRDSFFDNQPSWRGVFDIEFEGSLVTTATQLRRLENDIQLILKITLPLVLLLILLVFRKAEAFFFILLPPALGATWSFGLARLAFGGVSAITLAFILLAIAIGIQYSVHLYHRFVLELYRTHNYYRALTRSYLETGRGILASAVVVALICFIQFFASLRGVAGLAGVIHVLKDSRGFGQLGMMAGLTILCNVAAVLLTLPLLASIKHWRARGRVKPVGLYRFHLDRLYEPALTNPRATLLVLLLLTVFLCHPTDQLNFHPVSVAPFLYQPELASEAKKKADFPQPGRPIIAVVRGKTRQEALERNDRLYENLLGLDESYNVLAYDSLRPVLPSLRSQKASLDRLAAMDLEPFRGRIEAASAAAGFKPGYFAPFIEALEAFKLAAAQNPKYINYTADTDDELFHTLSDTVPRYMTRRANEYAVTTVIYPHEGGFPAAVLGRLAAELKKNGLEDLTLIGDPLIERDLARMVKFNLAIMMLVSVLVIYLALIIHFHGTRLAWITFLPVLAEIVWLGGVMAIAGIQIHFFTVLVMPLVLSLGLDNALQMTQYFHDRRPCSVRHVMLSVGRVTMLTSGMTALLYGTLALTSFPGMRDFGAVVLFACGLVLVGTVMLLPALLILFGRNQSIMEALMVEGEG